MLPSQILKYFAVVGVEPTSREIQISLNERMSEEFSSDVHFESKGFNGSRKYYRFPYKRPLGLS